MELKNVDDMIVKDINERFGVSTPPESVPVPNPITQSESQEMPEDHPELANQDDDTAGSNTEPEPEKAEAASPVEVTDSPIDEYGNPIAKPKLYTQEELNQIIRDRLSRGRHTEQQPQQQQPSQPQQPSQSVEGDDNWEAQLEQFIDKTLTKRQQQQQEVQWRQQEAQRQAEFESKFSSGINKYQDFHQVVQGKPITDSMLMATRALENPADFIYAASKTQVPELERIARISDPAAQAMEVGRLHERMVKQRNMLSKAAKPLDAPKSDLPVKTSDQLSIDQLIINHAKQKFARK